MNHWGVEIWLSITMFSWPFFFSNFVQFYQKMLILFLFPPHNYTETTDAIFVIDAKLQNYLFRMCSISISRCFLRHLFFDKLRLWVAFWIRLLIQFIQYTYNIRDDFSKSWFRISFRMVEQGLLNTLYGRNPRGDFFLINIVRLYDNVINTVLYDRLSLPYLPSLRPPPLFVFILLPL